MNTIYLLMVREPERGLFVLGTYTSMERMLVGAWSTGRDMSTLVFMGANVDADYPEGAWTVIDREWAK